MLNQYLKVLPSKTGQGVFTSVDIPANTPIIEVTGTIYVEKDLPDPNHPALLQVGSNTFIGPSGGPDDYINHSCNPNCFVHVVGNRAIVYSMYLIKAGSELTFDYATTATDTKDKWSMNCNCGDYNCRQVISGHHYLDEATKQKYIQKKALPLFITNPSLFLKRY
jgi:uncharacterized protein